MGTRRAGETEDPRQQEGGGCGMCKPGAANFTPCAKCVCNYQITLKGSDCFDIHFLSWLALHQRAESQVKVG